MRIADLGLRSRATVFFLMVALTIGGWMAYSTLPRESSPDIELPLIIVLTPYPGASPADVESQVTRVLERELKGLDGLKELTSSSEEGMSVVTVEFESGTKIDAALQKVRDRVDLAEPDFPEEAEEAQLQEINFSDLPILQVHLAGAVGPVVLKRLAEDLQDALESIPGVLRVGIVGGIEREVQVDVDPERLRLYGLSLDDVLDAVRNENVSIPGGDVDLGSQSFAVRVPGEVAEPAEIADFVIQAKHGSPIYIRDVATVRFGVKDQASYARINGRESVSLSIQKRQGANIIRVADAIRARVAEERVNWPAGVEVAFLLDLSKDIRRMVADLENNILSGVVLVVAVLFLVMGLRTAVLVGLAIPFSMFLTFLAVQAAGMTLNMMVLFSLVLSVGMLVDNAIVVIENIFRRMNEGEPRLEAASRGTSQVAWAIIGSTLTTVGAFLPLLFWPGVVGDFMSFLPITASIALLASLCVAFTINPVLAATFLKREVKPAAADGDDEPAGLRARWGARLLGAYRVTLAWSLNHRLAVIGLTLASFVLVVMLYGTLGHGVEFFPATEPNQIIVDVEMPPGTRLERTDEVVREVEARLAGLPDVRVTAAAVGTGSKTDFVGTASGGANGGRVTLDLVDRAERSQSSYRTLEQARARVVGIAGATIEVDRPQDGPPVGDPVAIELAGDDFATLGAAAARIRTAIADIPGLATLDDDFDLARPELSVVVDRTQAARLELTTADIATTVRTAMNGTKAAVYRYGEDEADITVRLAASHRASPEDLARLMVVTEDGAQVPLATVAKIERTSALVSIKHKDQKRVVTVSGQVTSPELAGPVREEALRRIQAIPNLLPPGTAMRFGGASEDEEEAKAFLSRAFLYALLLVLVIMVAQFNSWMLPLTIMTSVLMSMIGVLVGLMVVGLPFGIIMTGIGVISLAGIVVNNGIVLLEFAEEMRKEGVPRREAVLRTGLARIRPVLLTAVTTILGLIPLSTGYDFDFRAFHFTSGGESSQWWQSMGVAVIFGLGFATFLTLILVPVLYDLLIELRERITSRAARSPLSTPPSM